MRTESAQCGNDGEVRDIMVGREWSAMNITVKESSAVGLLSI